MPARDRKNELTEIGVVHPLDIRSGRAGSEQFEFQKPMHYTVRYVDRAAAEDYCVEPQLVADSSARRADVGRMMLGCANGW
jgi:hypothetical protein